MIQITQLFNGVVIYNEDFDTSVTEKYLREYVRENGNSPRGSIVLSPDEYSILKELLAQVREEGYDQGFDDGKHLIEENINGDTK